MNEIKKEIKELMEQRGETIKDIASVLGIPIFKAFYELAGDGKNMEVYHALELADHFGVDVATII